MTPYIEGDGIDNVGDFVIKYRSADDVALIEGLRSTFAMAESSAATPWPNPILATTGVVDAAISDEAGEESSDSPRGAHVVHDVCELIRVGSHSRHCPWTRRLGLGTLLCAFCLAVGLAMYHHPIYLGQVSLQGARVFRIVELSACWQCCGRIVRAHRAHEVVVPRSGAGLSLWLSLLVFPLL